MTIPTEAANDALNITLAVVQSLMKRCIKVKEGDPEALKLSDEIARCMARDLKLYSGNATSFSPWLLSFAAVVRQHSRGGAFQSVPDWTSVADDDPWIKDHPQSEKTMVYHPPSVLDVPAVATSSTIPTTIPTTTSTLIVPPLTPSALPSMPCRMDPDLITKPNPSRTDLDLIAKPVAEPKRSSRPRAQKNLPLLGRPAGPPARFYHLYVDKTKKKPEKGVLQVGNSRKRKAEDEDTDGAVVVVTPKLPSPSQEPMKKKKKLSQNVEKRPTGIIDVKPKPLPTVTTDKVVLLGDDKGFQDAETRPAEWGSDAHIATLCQHSVCYHPRQCNKCTKLDIPCIVLPDKKFGCTQLVCVNCDQMKIACAIDGVGVRQRMQVKAAAATSKPAGHSRTRIQKSRAISKTPAKRILAQPPRVKLNIVEEPEQQPSLPADAPIPIIGTSQWPEQGDQLVPTNRADPEPTARDILQGIRGLSKRLDLLATNERVDTLEIRVHSVENILHQRLNTLEQRLNAPDAR
ncbi:uncharacterized protein F5147DRAFT_780529 [Suillus discolor]|uniref:Uncharacterized protein n=1 Tax=Suillus discolor TaxID=1912936 RepID=A0A9P7JMW1_9AGAM|nr:uncharacterized protein F5147DRAFT_780529 [Suillus discolor]KAG2089736.1 hypothetical protein F5147DRAFT_780529 [Suillus discolor]